MKSFVSFALATVTAYAAHYDMSTGYLAGPTIWNDEMEVAAQLSIKITHVRGEDDV